MATILYSGSIVTNETFNFDDIITITNATLQTDASIVKNDDLAMVTPIEFTAASRLSMFGTNSFVDWKGSRNPIAGLMPRFVIVDSSQSPGAKSSAAWRDLDMQPSAVNNIA